MGLSQGVVPPGALTVSRDIFVVTTYGEDATGIWGAEARVRPDILPHAGQPHDENCLSQNPGRRGRVIELPSSKTTGKDITFGYFLTAAFLLDDVSLTEEWSGDCVHLGILVLFFSEVC